VKEYLSLCRAVKNRLSKDLELLKALTSSEQASNNNQTQYKNLEYYYEMLVKHIDLVDRRILKGEQIPHSEKVFSIFEPHAEWLAKGKTNHPVEIGHNTSITTDQYHFILTHKVLEKEVDKEQPQPLAEDIKANYLNTGFYKLASSSFDRGFYSKDNDDCWKEICETVVMPKPGKKSKIRQAEESEPQFKHFKKKHSAVESNINELEHAGVSRVPDRGIDGFKRYVALGVLAYNIKRLGKVIADKEAGKKSG
jgi:IS5 family transposase